METVGALGIRFTIQARADKLMAVEEDLTLVVALDDR